MKKMVNCILLILVAIFIVSGCTDDSKDINNTNQNNSEATSYTKDDLGIIGEITETDKNIPEISLYLLGHYGDNITNEKLDGIKKYNFDAIVESANNFYKRNFTGIKVLDLIEWVNIDPNVGKRVTFEGYNLVRLTYEFTEFNDNSWIIYEIDNKPVLSNSGLNNIGFMQIDKTATNWSFGIESIIISS